MKKKRLLFIMVALLACMLPTTVLAKRALKYEKNYVIGVGEKAKLDYGDNDPETLVWTSSDEKRVTVTKNGNIYGNKVGAASITCTDEEGNVFRTFNVTVKQAPKTIKLNVSRIAKFPNRKTRLVPVVNKRAVCNTFKYKSSNKRVATVTSKGIVKTKSPGNATITVSTYNGVSKKVKVRVKDPAMAVALTFDDGPVYSNTSPILNTLKDYEYHATFFMVGYEVAPCKELVKKMVKDGHELGVHTWDHPNLFRLSEAAIDDSIQKTRKAIYDACGQYPAVFRPPYGNTNDTVSKVCRKYKMPIIIWNTDMEDWKVNSSVIIKNNILNRVHPGAVILIHDLHAKSRDAIIAAIPELKKRGYELVTVSELAKLRGVKLKPGEKFYGTTK